MSSQEQARACVEKHQGKHGKTIEGVYYTFDIQLLDGAMQRDDPKPRAQAEPANGESSKKPGQVAEAPRTNTRTAGSANCTRSGEQPPSLISEETIVVESEAPPAATCDEQDDEIVFITPLVLPTLPILTNMSSFAVGKRGLCDDTESDASSTSQGSTTKRSSVRHRKNPKVK
uniref:Uncharacterized protein n=1 Tax=Anopheles atroparvus TaxID=41427 RepID=A0A182IUR4_ANOAO